MNSPPRWAPSRPSYNGFRDAFVSKLNATGSALVYSTYLGGSISTTCGTSIAVDASGNAYVTGVTFGPRISPPHQALSRPVYAWTECLRDAN